MKKKKLKYTSLQAILINLPNTKATSLKKWYLIGWEAESEVNWEGMNPLDSWIES